MSINNRRRTCLAGQSSTALRPAKQQIIKQSSLEQTLRKFSSAEASSRIERSSPRLRLSSSERLEVKTALITDVCSDPTTPTKAASPFHRDGSPSTKKSTSSSSVDHHHSSSGTATTTKEIKSFRALAERWEAIASETPASSGSSPPAPNIATSKKPEPSVQPVDERDGSPTIPLTTTSNRTTASSARAVTSRSVSAGVVEIRKAFERVKEKLETESNCNYGQFGKRQFGKLQAAPLAIFAPAARLFAPLPAPTRPHVDSKTAACHLVTATVSGASVTVLITTVRSAQLRRHYVIGLVQFAHLSAGTSFLFNFSPSRNVPRYKNDTNRDSVMAPTSADRYWWCMDVNADLVANCISRFLFFFPIRWPEMRRQMRYNDSNTASDGKKKRDLPSSLGGVELSTRSCTTPFAGAR